MLKNKIKVSVIIPAKNEGKYLALCIEAIKKAFNNKTRYEIIIVNNNSTDNTKTIAKKYSCILIDNAKYGAASSRNIGAKNARGEYLAFIDADCVINKQWYANLSENLNIENVAAAGTKIMPDLEYATWVEKIMFYLNVRRGKKISKNAIEVKWIGSSNILIKKQVFDKIGGFDEDFITCEDYDLSQRVSEQGKILLDNRIFTTHMREDKTLNELFRNEIYRGKNSLKNWIRNGYQLYEMPSIIVPAIFFALILISLVTYLVNPKLGFFFSILVIIIPLIITFRSKKIILNPTLIFQSLIVISTYLLARAISLFKEIIIIFK
jgi:glycosyltransferase involved in cell wall biosynthesis